MVLLVALAVAAHHVGPEAAAAHGSAHGAAHDVQQPGLGHVADAEPLAPLGLTGAAEMCLAVLLLVGLLVVVATPLLLLLVPVGVLLPASARPRLPFLRARAGPRFLCVSLR